MTSFDTIIDAFLSKITDDMYLELTEEDTIRDAKQYLLDAIPYFEFPRFALYDYDAAQGVYNVDLTKEEINIFAILMKQAWLDRQINSVENTRMKYSGSDFKFTSQANHLQKLLTLKAENNRENIHAQRLYKRRKFHQDGHVMSNWHILNQSAISEQNKTTNEAAYGIDNVTQVNVYTNDDDTYYWDPIVSASEDSDKVPIGGENE